MTRQGSLQGFGGPRGRKGSMDETSELTAITNSERDQGFSRPEKKRAGQSNLNKVGNLTLALALDLALALTQSDLNKVVKKGDMVQL